jgi:hypothetical protein
LSSPLADGTSAFQQCFAAWLVSLGEADSDEKATAPEDKTPRQIAIDGKYLRRSHHHARGLGPLLLVNAWATKRGIALGQLAVAEKPDEFTAFPQLLDQLDVTGAVVTIAFAPICYYTYSILNDVFVFGMPRTPCSHPVVGTIYGTSVKHAGTPKDVTRTEVH